MRAMDGRETGSAIIQHYSAAAPADTLLNARTGK
jgi:hypothetical protein